MFKRYLGTLAFRCLIALFVIGLPILGGCGAYQRYDEARKGLAATLRMRWFAVAVLEYKKKNGEYPDDLKSLEPLFGTNKGAEDMKRTLKSLKETFGEVSFEEMFENPLTGDNPGFEYVKPVNPTPDTPVIYMLKDGERQTDAKIGYFNGSIRKPE